MLVFGIDIPLVEVILALGVIMFLLFVEAVIIIALLIRQMSKSKQLAGLLEKLSETLLALQKAELEELDKLRKK